MGSSQRPPGRSAADSQHRRATIDDVARVAGVSRQTVSNVIHGRGRLGKDTHARVQQAITSLRYVPHPGASSMRSRRTMQLAHPMPAIELDPGNAIAIEFIQALVTAAGHNDRHILLTASNDPIAEIEELIRSGRVDAFVFSNLEPHDRRIELVAERGMPFACFGRTEPDLPQCWVDVDNAAGIATATNHLLDAGHTEVAYFGYAGDSYWDYERIDGYRDTMQAASRTPRCVLTANNLSEIAAAAVSLVGADRPTAIVAGSDALAAALYSAADRHGVAIGVDLAVTGFDGSVIGRNLSPRLTTLAIPIAEVAAHVVTRVLSEVEGPTGEPGEMLPLTFVKGEST